MTGNPFSNHGLPGERLARFEAWLTEALRRKLPGLRPREVFQIRAAVFTFVTELHQAGWDFHAKALADLIEDRLDEVATAVAAGRVQSLYKFTAALFQRYSREKAEELRDRSKALGTHVDSVLQRFLARGPTAAAATPAPMTTIVAEYRAARQASRRRPSAAPKSASPPPATGELFS